MTSAGIDCAKTNGKFSWTSEPMARVLSFFFSARHFVGKKLAENDVIEKCENNLLIKKSHIVEILAVSRLLGSIPVVPNRVSVSWCHQ